jgi:L-lysine 2,3-aminomutase
VLICEQDDKNHPKLTPEAGNRFEVEKQNQIKQYMEDIIAKLQQKDRRFKVTVKKKFVDDALFNSTSIRVASVYVIVINREKTYDPILNQMMFKSRKRMSGNKLQDSSSEEDEAERLAKEDHLMRQ